MSETTDRRGFFAWCAAGVAAMVMPNEKVCIIYGRGKGQVLRIKCKQETIIFDRIGSIAPMGHVRLSELIWGYTPRQLRASNG